jgi:amino acid adenylation domain-containing protein
MQSLMLDIRTVPEQIFDLLDGTPSGIALSDGDQQLTYYELNRRADQFAGYLGELGVAPGGTVALCIERSFDWIVAALGIMRVGAAYVPLDFSWPDARLNFAIEDSGATVLVARQALLHRLSFKEQGSVQGVDPARDAHAIAATPLLPRRILAPETLAYVIYTSGSTGTPKGVEITHANLNHLASWYRKVFGVTREDRASHLLGLGFDAAVMEIWPHLSAGATLCLASETVRSSPDLIQEWILRERVTIALMPTLLGERLITMEWPPTTTLRLLIIGGDVLERGPAFPLPFAVVNNYGPTECTVAATYSVLEPGTLEAPPIGRAITGTSVYLLDEQHEPVADGETGEIYIGGDGVGRGYRNLPDLTQERFLSDPFAAIPAARMYRTGDRGVRRPNGEIEFRGRLDRQIKMRGFRIELDEIASILHCHTALDFATVVTRPSEMGETQLVAYVMPKGNEVVPTADDLQQYLLKRLPDYMVPSAFFLLDALPLSANGKIDLSRLAQYTNGRMLEKNAVKKPASSVEQKVLAMVRGILKNDEVGTADNFFLAGGHSLLATQLLVRLRSEFGIDLALRQLLESATVEELANQVEKLLRQPWLAQVWAEVLGRTEVRIDDNFFALGGEPELLAAVQWRIAVEFGRQIPIHQLVANPTVREQTELMSGASEAQPMLPPGVITLQPKGAGDSIFWMHYCNFGLSNAVGENQPFLVVRVMAEDFPSLGEEPSLQAIAACHVHKILSTQPRGRYTIGGICLGAVLALEVAQQLRSAGSEVSLILLDPPTPCHVNGSKGPRWNQPLYTLKRAARLGVRTSSRAARLGVKTSLAKVRTRVARVNALLKAEIPKTEVDIAQRMLTTAAAAYQPMRYDGTVLLVVPSERPPHLDFLPVWQKIMLNNLHVANFDGYQDDMLEGEGAQWVADAIHAHLASAIGRE